MRKTYIEQIRGEIEKSRNLRDSARMLYYTDALGFSAVVSWDVFKTSAAGLAWLEKHYRRIAQFRGEQNRRFGWKGEWT